MECSVISITIALYYLSVHDISERGMISNDINIRLATGTIHCCLQVSIKKAIYLLFYNAIYSETE